MSEKNHRNSSLTAKATTVLRDVHLAQGEKRKMARMKDDEDERSKADEAVLRKTKIQQAQEAAEAAKAARLTLCMANRAADFQREIQTIYNAAYNKWLQIDYPTNLALGLIESFRRSDKTKLNAIVQAKLAEGAFKRRLHIQNLWSINQKLLHTWREERPSILVQEKLQKLVPVKCTTMFSSMVMTKEGGSHGVSTEMGIGGEVLIKIVEKFMPRIKDILNQSKYTVMLILEMNDFIMEKAVVWMIWALQKWLGMKKWSAIADWPPIMPESFKPNRLAYADAEEKTLSSEG